jgi:hypothetical protein
MSMPVGLISAPCLCTIPLSLSLLACLVTSAGVPWKNGFTTSAENWNGRAAMLGFAGILVLELITGQGITTGLGLLE